MKISTNPASIQGFQGASLDAETGHTLASLANLPEGSWIGVLDKACQSPALAQDLERKVVELDSVALTASSDGMFGDMQTTLGVHAELKSGRVIDGQSFEVYQLSSPVSVAGRFVDTIEIRSPKAGSPDMEIGLVSDQPVNGNPYSVVSVPVAVARFPLLQRSRGELGPKRLFLASPLKSDHLATLKSRVPSFPPQSTAENPTPNAYPVFTAPNNREWITDCIGSEYKLGWGFAFADIDQATPHFHKIMNEPYIGLNGSFTVHNGEATSTLNPGDVVNIIAGTVHWAEGQQQTPARLGVFTFPEYDPADSLPASARAEYKEPYNPPIYTLADELAHQPSAADMRLMPSGLTKAQIESLHPGTLPSMDNVKVVMNTIKSSQDVRRQIYTTEHNMDFTLDIIDLRTTQWHQGPAKEPTLYCALNGTTTAILKDGESGESALLSFEPGAILKLTEGASLELINAKNGSPVRLGAISYPTK